jgi:chorismate dehydratase
MNVTRISASSYSNTAPLVWSFLYGQNHGKVELILDTAPARSAELLAEKRVGAALVPVIGYQLIDGVRLVPDVCVGALEKVRSVCLVTKGKELNQVRSVALDVSSRTSAFLTKIIFREFLSTEPAYTDAQPELESMLAGADCALLIGDPSLMIDESRFRKFDLVETWKSFTGLGFVFAMWMTYGTSSPIDFAAARDEGLSHVDEIIANYETEIFLERDEMIRYLTENISYRVEKKMEEGMELYFKLAHQHALIADNKPLKFASSSPKQSLAHH